MTQSFSHSELSLIFRSLMMEVLLPGDIAHDYIDQHRVEPPDCTDVKEMADVLIRQVIEAPNQGERTALLEKSPVQVRRCYYRRIEVVRESLQWLSEGDKKRIAKVDTSESMKEFIISLLLQAG